MNGIRPAVRLMPRTWRWRIPVLLLYFLLIAATIASGYVYWLLDRSAPVVEGELVLPDLYAPVKVWRDANGVPHIEAENEHDLFLAQGYVTAQDRLFQMDLSRRQASGLLSEVIGDATLDRDKFFRTLGLRRAAESSYEMYSEEAKQVLQWYADGVNAYLKQAVEENRLPIECTILGYTPRKWTPIDSLTIGKYMAFDLGGHWEGQAFRHYLLQHFPEEKALDLFPSYPKDGPTIIETLRTQSIDYSKSFASAVIPPEWNGSNNWVLSGKKSASGKPMLANDPHLGLGTPSIWYETHLSSPQYRVSGVIFAGVPGIIIGNNENIAWGVTNVGPDVQDLYIEKRNPSNPREFLYNGKWEQATVIRETIPVKGKEPVTFEVTITRHGPVLSEYAHDDKPDTVLSMEWTALLPSAELEAVLRFNRASNWEEFKEALTYFHTPAQNFVFASRDGTIAYRANGLIPIRKKGDGMVPVPGWTDEYGWQGFIPWEELPTVVNPKSGYIATANNKVAPDDYPYHLSHTWAQPYRQMRIKEVLESRETWTVEEMKRLQFDQTNLQAREFLPLLLSETEKEQGNLNETEKAAMNLLRDWDYVDRAEKGAPLLFHFWMEEIANVLFESDIPDEMEKLFEGKAAIVDQLLRRAREGNPGPWIRDKGGLTKVTTNAFHRAVKRVVSLQGESPEEWKWGEYHTLIFEHPLGAVKPLHLFFNPEAIPLGGSRVTVMAAGWDSSTGIVDHGGAWRRVIDLADLTRSHNMVGPGQSGHLLSPWYDDQVKDWATGGYHVTSMRSDEYRKAGHLLVLKPE